MYPCRGYTHLYSSPFSRTYCRRLIASRASRSSIEQAEPAVKSIDLDSYRLMHESSFSHRNLKTYMVAVIVPGSSQCRAAEEEFSRLANGLRHEQHIVLATMNALESREHFSFCTSTLQIKSYPAVLLYPEGSPGMLRYKGSEVTVHGLVDALNGSFRATGNHRQVELEIPNSQGSDSNVSTVRSIENDRKAIGDTAMRLKGETSSYWIPGKALFWSFVLLFGLSSFVWDRWLGDWWALRQLSERQVKRKAGEQFDEDTNEEDILQLSYLDANRSISETLEKKEGAAS